MEVDRIKHFNLEHRPMFSGIYGPGIKDIFVGPDLRVCGIEEMLYRTFKNQGFHVVFYSQHNLYNFYSFRKEDLVELYNLRKSTQQNAGGGSGGGGRYMAKIKSPFGNRRRNMATQAAQPKQADDENNYDQIKAVGEGAHTYYRINDNVDPFAIIDNYIRRSKKKMVIIFSTADADIYANSEAQLTVLTTLKRDFNSHDWQTHIVALYNWANADQLFEDSEGQLFRSKFFQEALGGTEEQGSRNQMYCITGPQRDEYRNMLNRRRLIEGYNELIDEQGIEAKAIRLSQITTPKCKDKQAYVGEMEMLNHYAKMPLPTLKETIDKMNNERSIDQLRAMAGTENIIRQIETYIEALKDARNNPNSVRFRPHLVFSGNPGTGKTTVARLLADILREEGLLERGHLIEATVGDLEGQYVGQTRIKTQALCDRARGGVLFIDEAYGLMSGSGGHGDHADYGKEAIEVLIQFMENSTDSLVILAGYKADMENLIKNGNQGFMRRFNGKESFINFEDYSDEALFQIFARQLKGYQTTPEFDDAMHRIITYMYLHRNARWGNAGEMEKLASSILSARRRRGSKDALSVKDIPEDKMRLISDDIDISSILVEVNALIGLSEVKKNLEVLLLSTLGRRMEAREIGEIDNEKPNLNFIFEGNPGTGKTTVAKLMAKILHSLGLIDDITPAEIETGTLINSGVGDTQKAVEQMFRDNSGKVVLIDEAYGLAKHGTDAIDTIVKCLTDKRFEGNQALILAGYTEDMEQMMAMNDGMRRRFKNIWHFANYTNDELWEIIQHAAANKKFYFEPADMCRELAFAHFDAERTRGRQFGNAGLAIGLFESLRETYEMNKARKKASGRVIIPEYFPNYAGPRTTIAANVSPTTAQPAPTAGTQTALEITLDDKLEFAVREVDDFANAVGLVSGRNGMGTGFFISVKHGLVVTASHVIENNPDLLFYMNRGSMVMGASVVWNNPTVDIAILRCNSTPSDARYFRIDTDTLRTPTVREKILHCGFVKGTDVSTNFFTYEGAVNNYDPQKLVAERCFDAILSSIDATNGCSGGPVMRANDFTVIGVLQGGFNDAPARIISDIHQLYKQITLTIN